MIETLLFAVRDEPIASGVASHLRVREFGVPKPGANMALTPCFLLIPNKAIRTRCNAIQAVSDELARESLAVVLNQKAFKADMKTAQNDDFVVVLALFPRYLGKNPLFFESIVY